ncbi:isomerase [Streptomyces sp. ms191]|uniref:5-carboxymethyl-2-hydroxymuconate Delta-isomerase n=1 Tax=unclassified Streptomyces TaxID=2593676 RepID=UPI0011CEA355|nr:isomerase [Streptomyces sp. ms191]TXS29432.1 isomerase [Streptomyces sp. ms191]
MPQITVDYSAPLDRRGFALALHPLVVDTVDTVIDACKTRFREIEETVCGDGSTDDVVVHVDIALLAGRSEETKARLTEAVLALLPLHLKQQDGVRISAEVRDLDPSYRSR